MALLPFLLNYSPTTHFYTLSLHDALPISRARRERLRIEHGRGIDARGSLGRAPHDREVDAAIVRTTERARTIDRKSTRLNSSHQIISYAVFCLKKKMRNRADGARLPRVGH